MAANTQALLAEPGWVVELTPEERAALRERIMQQRPEWVPDEVGDDYNRDTYAYQTERERMPEGPDHTLLMAALIQMLQGYVESAGWYITGDVYIEYFDPYTLRRKRIAPDIMVSRKAIEPPHRSYITFDMLEPPLAVFELTSPDTGASDRAKAQIYAGLQIPLFVVLDIVKTNNLPRNPYLVEVYQLAPGLVYERLAPDEEGTYLLEVLGLSMRVEGQRVSFTVLETGERLLTSRELEQARRLAEEASQEAEAENERLRAELARLRGERPKGEAS
jgi:Uma2 family endonuclease